MEGSEALEVVWWRTSTDLSLLRSKESEHEEDEIVEEEVYSSQGGLLAFQVSSARQRT